MDLYSIAADAASGHIFWTRLRNEAYRDCHGAEAAYGLFQRAINKSVVPTVRHRFSHNLMDLNVLDPNNPLRRVLTFAAAVPTNSTLASLNAALQTLKEGGSGLQWVASGASSALVFANRNVVVPLLKAATPASCSSSYSSLHRAADAGTDAEQLQFAQASRRRRSGRIVLQQQPGAAATKGKKARKASARATSAHAVSVGLYSLSLHGGPQSVHANVMPDEEEQQESVQVMHMGLQSSML